MGPNIRVVTKEGIMKVVNSIKARGFIKNPVCQLWFSTHQMLGSRKFKKIKENPALIAEIIESPDKMYDAGAQRIDVCMVGRQ